MDEAIADSLRRIYTAIQRREWSELEANVSHDMEVDLPEALPWGGIHHGPDGMRTVFEIYRDHVEGIWADLDEVIAMDDRVIVFGRIRGSARSTSRDFEVPFAHVWSLSDGVPSRLRGYFDTAPITAALQEESD